MPSSVEGSPVAGAQVAGESGLGGTKLIERLEVHQAPGAARWRPRSRFPGSGAPGSPKFPARARTASTVRRQQSEGAGGFPLSIAWLVRAGDEQDPARADHEAQPEEGQHRSTTPSLSPLSAASGRGRRAGSRSRSRLRRGCAESQLLAARSASPSGAPARRHGCRRSSRSTPISGGLRRTGSRTR